MIRLIWGSFLLLTTGCVKLSHKYDLNPKTLCELATYVAKKDFSSFLSYLIRNIKEKELSLSDASKLFEDKDGSPILHMATKIGDIASIEFLLANGASLQEKNKDGYTALHVAIDNDQKQGLEVLVSYLKDGEINATYDRGKTLLYYAAECNKSEMVTILLNRKDIDTNKENYYGNTPIHVSSRLGYHAIVKLLLASESVDINLKNKQEEIAIYIAWARGHTSILKLLFNDKRNQYNNFCTICLHSICLDKEILYITTCKHFFHEKCFKQWVDTKPNCPVCREEIKT